MAIDARVVVIGGSSSIGRAVVKRLVGQGAHVLATYAHMSLSSRPDVTVSRLDLEDADRFPSFAQRVASTLGPPDAVVFLAGVLPGKSLADYTDPDIERVMTVNFTAQAKLVKALLPIMADNGQFLFISSVSARRGSFDPVYAASKAAIVAFTQSLAAWHGEQFRFNCLAPRLIEDSTMYHAMSVERRNHHRRESSTGKLLSVEQVAEIVVDLLRRPWSDLNGVVLDLG